MHHPPRPTGTLDLKEFTKLCRALDVDVASFSSSDGSMKSVTSVIDKGGEQAVNARSRGGSLGNRQMLLFILTTVLLFTFGLGSGRIFSRLAAHDPVSKALGFLIVLVLGPTFFILLGAVALIATRALARSLSRVHSQENAVRSILALKTKVVFVLLSVAYLPVAISLLESVTHIHNDPSFPLVECYLEAFPPRDRNSTTVSLYLELLRPHPYEVAGSQAHLNGPQNCTSDAWPDDSLSHIPIAPQVTLDCNGYGGMMMQAVAFMMLPIAIIGPPFLVAWLSIEARKRASEPAPGMTYGEQLDSAELNHTTLAIDLRQLIQDKQTAWRRLAWRLALLLVAAILFVGAWGVEGRTSPHHYFLWHGMSGEDAGSGVDDGSGYSDQGSGDGVWNILRLMPFYWIWGAGSEASSGSYEYLHNIDPGSGDGALIVGSWEILRTISDFVPPLLIVAATCTGVLAFRSSPPGYEYGRLPDEHDGGQTDTQPKQSNAYAHSSWVCALEPRLDTAALVPMLRPYESEYAWWKATTLTDKLLVALAAQYATQPTHQAIAMATIFGMSLLASAVFRPFAGEGLRLCGVPIYFLQVEDLIDLSLKLSLTANACVGLGLEAGVLTDAQGLWILAPFTIFSLAFVVFAQRWSGLLESVHTFIRSQRAVAPIKEALRLLEKDEADKSVKHPQDDSADHPLIRWAKDPKTNNLMSSDQSPKSQANGIQARLVEALRSKIPSFPLTLDMWPAPETLLHHAVYKRRFRLLHQLIDILGEDFVIASVRKRERIQVRIAPL